jgi:hypothetical protein
MGGYTFYYAEGAPILAMIQMPASIEKGMMQKELAVVVVVILMHAEGNLSQIGLALSPCRRGSHLLYGGQ